jgi:hypothetical protein
MTSDRSLLEAALIGYIRQRDEIDAKITEIEEELGGSARGNNASHGKTARGMSAEGRARIAEAQRKRWAAVRGRNPKQTARPASKRRLSPEGRRRIAEATRKRWAAYRAQKA